MSVISLSLRATCDAQALTAKLKRRPRSQGPLLVGAEPGACQATQLLCATNETRDYGDSAGALPVEMTHASDLFVRDFQSLLVLQFLLALFYFFFFLH
jgi:hypothetical protein